MAKDQGMDGSHIGPLECSLADCEMLLAALEELKDGNTVDLPQDIKKKSDMLAKVGVLTKATGFVNFLIKK